MLIGYICTRSQVISWLESQLMPAPLTLYMLLLDL